MTEQVHHLLIHQAPKARFYLADAHDEAGQNGTAKRIRRGVVTDQELIAMAAIEKALSKGSEG